MAERLIEVTQEDIDNGVPGRCSSCPVARALDRQIGGWNFVGMSHISHFDETPGPPYKPETPSYTTIVLGIDCKSVDPPDSVQRFIHDFDEGEDVKPFSFSLELE